MILWIPQKIAKRTAEVGAFRESAPRTCMHVYALSISFFIRSA